MPHVFISYSRDDKERMQRVKRTLMESGVEVWTDEGIQEGTPNWQIAIESAIEDAACIVCILTPTAKSSIWVREELMYATLYEKQIYMLHMEGDYKRVAILGFTVVQFIDLRDEDHYVGRMANLANRVHEQSRQRDEAGVTHQLRVISRQPLVVEEVDVKPQSQAEEIISKFLPIKIPDSERHVFIVKAGNEYSNKSVYTLEDTFVRVGREDHNFMHVDEHSVSRDHSLLIYTNDGFLIRDLGSTNGTYVNAERVEIRSLSEGDEIQIGLNFSLVYKIIHVKDVYDDIQTQAAIRAISGEVLGQVDDEVLDNLKSNSGQTDQVETVRVDDLKRMLEDKKKSSDT